MGVAEDWKIIIILKFRQTHPLTRLILPRNLSVPFSPLAPSTYLSEAVGSSAVCTFIIRVVGESPKLHLSLCWNCIGFGQGGINRKVRSPSRPAIYPPVSHQSTGR